MKIYFQPGVSILTPNHHRSGAPLDSRAMIFEIVVKKTLGSQTNYPKGIEPRSKRRAKRRLAIFRPTYKAQPQP